MEYSTSRDGAGRAAHGAARAVLLRVNTDGRRIQEADVLLNWGERRTKIERLQNYGFTSHPLPRQGRAAAEGVVVFASGDRSHPLLLNVDDRRHRPRDLKPGESMIYDDQGQRVYISRDGIRVVTSKKVWVEADDDVTVKTKKKVDVEAGTEVVAGIKDKRFVRIREHRIDLAVKSKTEQAPFKVITEGGPSAVVWARMD